MLINGEKSTTPIFMYRWTMNKKASGHKLDDKGIEENLKSCMLKKIAAFDKTVWPEKMEVQGAKRKLDEFEWSEFVWCHMMLKFTLGIF